MKKVNENSPTLRENSPAPRSFFGGQTAPSPAHCERSAQIICIGHVSLCAPSHHTEGQNLLHKIDFPKLIQIDNCNSYGIAPQKC